MDNMPDIVDVVLYFLGFLSVVVWAIIIFKSIVWFKAHSACKAFIERLVLTRHLREIANTPKTQDSSFARICQAGIKALDDLRSHSNLSKEDCHEVLMQSLRQQAYFEQKRLDSGLAVLASIGSTAPFIGLFGTVWGIMNALKRITATGSAGLDVVAGPIGEALIATAIGIATAVPAVLAYNYFMRKLKVHNAEMEQVAAKFQSLVIKSGTES